MCSPICHISTWLRIHCSRTSKPVSFGKDGCSTRWQQYRERDEISRCDVLTNDNHARFGSFSSPLHRQVNGGSVKQIRR